MVFRWFFHRNHKPKINKSFTDLPNITVQIPLYNERCVAARICDAVAALDYPANKLQIQIVDDSTDETSDIVAERIAFHKTRGVCIEHVQRKNRHGFKAGALKEAMVDATGEFIAIFDADFIPPVNLLRDTINHFADDEIAMVQYRWEHLNRYSNKLTETQSMMLDSHFALEQQVRSASGMLFNFNGTAGMWRKSAIIDAGNWSADTLTEDLDLSYRAQMRGWKMKYLNEVGCPGEIPANLDAFRSQQHRWAKGGVQVMLKMLKTVWRAPLSLKVKLESTFHLSNNLAYLVMLTDTLFFLIPSLLIREYYGIQQIFWFDIFLVLASTGGHLIYLVFGQVALGRSLLQALKNTPRLILLGIQLSINNARAALEAIAGHQSEFVRTPKSGDLKSSADISHESATQRLYQAVRPKGATLELLLAGVYACVLLWAVINGLWFMLPFILLLTVGYSATAITSWQNRQQVVSG